MAGGASDRRSGAAPKVISGSATTAYEQWELPQVQAREVVATGPRSMARPMTAAQLEQMHKQAYEDGFEQGLAEGREQGRREGRAVGEAEAQALGERLRGVLEALSEPLQALDQEMVAALVSLATGIARHLVRRELKADPRQVIALVREAVSVLPAAERRVSIHLHPEDAALVREVLSVHEGESAWHIVEDPVMTRGGCRALTEISQVDATVESRLAQVVAKVMGEERDGERPA